MAEQPIIVKKKVVKGHGHHGGSWKVAYADFVTAMMAFFMVMWLMSMSDETKDRIQGYFNDPLGFTSSAPRNKTILTMEGSSKAKPTVTAGKGNGDNAGEGEQKVLQQVQNKVARALTDPQFKNISKDVRLSVTRDGLLIQFIEAKGAVFFESGSSKIRPEAEKIVARIAPILAASKHLLEIQGHTDAQPFGGQVNGNWALSGDRAMALQNALAIDNVPDSQFAGIRSLASTHLLDPQHPLSYVNRRVTILLPREYSSDSLPIKPKDQLRNAVNDANQPEAVIVQPKTPDLLTSRK